MTLTITPGTSLPTVVTVADSTGIGFQIRSGYDSSAPSGSVSVYGGSRRTFDSVEPLLFHTLNGSLYSRKSVDSSSLPS